MLGCFGCEVLVFLSFLPQSSSTIFHDETQVFWHLSWQTYYQPSTIISEFLHGQRVYYERMFGVSARCENTSEAQYEEEEETERETESQGRFRRSVHLYYDPVTIDFCITITIPFFAPIYNRGRSTDMKWQSDTHDNQVNEVKHAAVIDSEPATYADDADYIEDSGVDNFPPMKSNRFEGALPSPIYEENSKNRSLVSRGDTRVTARTIFYQDTDVILFLVIAFWTEDSLQDVLWRLMSASAGRSFSGFDFLNYMEQCIAFFLVVDVPFSTPIFN